MTWIGDSRPLHWGAIAGAGLVLALLLAIAPAHGAEERQQDSGLFSPVEPQEFRRAALAPPDDITMRRREVTIDFDMLELSKASVGRLDTPPARLTLNLFDDTVLTAVIEEVAPTSSGYSLSGRIEASEPSTVILVVNGTVVAGSVRTLEGTYRIRSVGKRLYAISEVDESRLPPIE